MFFRDDAVCFEVVEIIEEIVFQLVFIVDFPLAPWGEGVT